MSLQLSCKSCLSSSASSDTNARNWSGCDPRRCGRPCHWSAQPASASEAQRCPAYRPGYEKNGKYIISLKEGVSASDVLGPIATEGGDDVLDILLSHPGVERVEEDGLVTIDEVVTQPDAPWGISRVTSLETVSGANTPSYPYTYDDSPARAGSLRFSPSNAIDAAVKALTDAGVHVAASAGNNYGSDSSTQSPGRAPSANTVGVMGVTTVDDARSNFSNVGASVDIFAPWRQYH